MEENAKIVETEVKDFFDGVKAKKHLPPEEKIDSVILKHTIDALRKPPKSRPKQERLGSTISDRRLAERRAGKKIAQLGEQANQLCPLLKVSSDIFANDQRMVPGYTNLDDYLPDDVHYEFLEVD